MKSTMTNMLLSLSLIAASMGAILAGVHQVTADPIAESMLKAKTEAISEVLPEYDNNPLSTAEDIEEDGIRMRVYTATLDGITSGKAVETRTLDGFSGEISMIVGFGAEGEVTGYRILSHSETPGLGAKADKWFCDSAGNRSIIGSTGYLRVNKDGGDIDGITAATITSRAFLDAVNKARKAIEKQ